MKYTPFYEKHIKNGARMVEFAGYSMPIQFEEGIIAEHNAVRQRVGLFDVSHMGEFFLSGKKAFDTIQNLITNDISSLQANKARYTLIANAQGGVLDDILVYNFNDEKYMLVVNAANTTKDAEWIKQNLLDDTCFENASERMALLALQGRYAERMIRQIFDKKPPEKSFSFLVIEYLGEEIIISRTGYTGEDGFEIYSPNSVALNIFDKIMQAGEKYQIQLCGLGARDTLRLEAGMPLYSHEMDEKTLATEIGLNFAIKMNKQNFIGKDALKDTHPRHKRIGLKLIDRGIARQNALVYDGDEEIGIITSGSHSPTLGYPIAMARVKVDNDSKELMIGVRNRLLKAEVIALPFYKRT